MTPVETLLAKLSGVKKVKNGWSARCPAHKDRRPSLSISECEDGTVLLKCHANCKAPEILAAVGLEMKDLFLPNARATPTRTGKPTSGGQTFATSKDAVAGLERPLGKRSAMWTYHNGHGEPVGVVVRWDKPDGKDIRPVAWHEDGWRIGAMPEPRPPYGLPDLAPAPCVLVCEGEKAADAARSLGFVATTSAGGSQAARKTDWRSLAGKAVWIVPDNDAPGRKYADAVADILTKLTPAATVRVVELPGLPDGGDIVDWIDAHGDAAEPDAMRAEIEVLAQTVEQWRPLEGDDLAPGGQPATPEKGAGEDRPTEIPTIIIGPDELRVNDQAVSALAREPDIYHRGGLLVHVLDQPEDETGPDEAIRRPAGAPVVRELARPLLRERLTRCAHWVQRRQTRDGEEIEVPAHPPDWSIGAVHARGNWPGLRPLDAVVTFPVVLPDGSLLTANGYHPNTGVLVHLPSDLELAVPPRPGKADIAAAVELLFDPLLDFPFETPAHRSGLVAGLLTPLSWFLFDGPAPLFLIDKNVRGAGAGLLADVVALTVTGRRFSVMSYTADREELRKRITAVAMEGERLILLDNLAGAVGNDILDAALTADWWKDRVLGGNKIYNGPLHVVWFGTGNNVQMHADTARRVCHVRMESQYERPELRTGFRYPNLRQHLRQHRSTYLSAALTLLRAWVVAGRPRHGLPPWGSFEGWSDVVREAVVFAGLPDPGETRMALQTAADRDAAAMGDILCGMADLDRGRRGLTAADVVKRLKEHDGSDEVLVSMRSAVEELCGKLDGRALAMRFRSFKRRNFDGRFIDVGGTAQGTNRWVVLAGDGGKHPHHPHYPHRSPAADSGDGGDGGNGSALVGRESALPSGAGFLRNFVMLDETSSIP
jgi:hypothetical protein